MQIKPTNNPVHGPQRALARLVLALACSLAPALASAQGAAASPADTAFVQAMQHYEQNHWALAFEALSALADQGHPEAQRICLLMWRHGPSLYGTSLQASAERRQRWALGQRLLTAAR